MRLRSRGPAVVLGLALAVQVFATFHQFPPREIVSPWPVFRGDFNQHFYYAHQSADFFRRTGRLWGYDTNFMAGVPGPTIVDDNKLLALLFVALPFVREALVFKLFIVLSMLAPPLLVWLGARGLQASPGAAAAAAALATLYWVLDGFVGFFREIGLFPFNLASALLPAAAGLAHAFLRTGARKLLVVMVSASPLVLVHYLMPLLLAPVFGVLLLVHCRRTRRALAFLGWGALLLAWVSLWLIPFFRTAAMKTPSGTFWVFPFTWLLRELFTEHENTFNTITWSSLVARNLIWFLGVWGIVRLARGGGAGRAAALAAGALVFLLMAYGGLWWSAIASLQPYRFVIPLTFLLAVPAGSALAALVREAAAAPAPLRPVLALAPLLLVPTLWTDFGVYHRNVRETTGPLQASMQEAELKFIDFLKERTDESGRILFENHFIFKFPCHLPLLLRRQLIGGPYPHSFILHNHANFNSQRQVLFGRKYVEWDEPGLRRMLDLYNVRWLVTLAPPCPEPALDWARSRPALFREVQDFGSVVFFDVLRAGDWFLEGGGRVEAEPGRIRLRGLTAPVTAIKYHWFDGLRAEPEALLERVAHPDDPVGFLRVRNGSVRDLDLVLR